ncbi:MAG: site-2 protease family protein [Anaerolineae bacterium]|nr:site-2 protease family protein [Anaerolineae bacterium]
MYFAPAVDDQVWALRAAVEDVLTVETVQMGRGAVTFSGSLRHDAERSFAYLESRFSPLGYTPLLRRTQGTDEIVAVEGLVGVSRSNWLINALLFIATVISVLVVGLQIFSPLGALVYMLGLLLVLGCHEFGHYIVARIHGLAVTLPYFIPLPLPPLGTMGAFIRLKSPVINRKALFDMAVAGPLAGFFVALPIFMLGLLLPPEWTRFLQQARPVIRIQLLESWLVEFLVNLLLPSIGRFDLFRNPLTAVGWFGMLVTAINLLPAGQLDGGHIAYSLLGRWSRPLAVVVFVLLLYLGWQYWQGWFVWAFMLFLTGLSHPAPLNDITELDWARRSVAFGSFLLFLAIISVKPFGP